MADLGWPFIGNIGKSNTIKNSLPAIEQKRYNVNHDRP